PYASYLLSSTGVRTDRVLVPSAFQASERALLSHAIPNGAGPDGAIGCLPSRLTRRWRYLALVMSRRSSTERFPGGFVLVLGWRAGGPRTDRDRGNSADRCSYAHL